MIVEVLKNLKVEGGRIMNRGRYSNKDRPFPRQIHEELDSGRTNKVRFVRWEHHDKQSVQKKETPPQKEPVEEATDTLDRGEQDTLTASNESVESQSVEEEQPKRKSSSRRKKSSSTKSTSRSKKSE